MNMFPKLFASIDDILGTFCLLLVDCFPSPYIYLNYLPVMKRANALVVLSYKLLRRKSGIHVLKDISKIFESLGFGVD